MQSSKKRPTLALDSSLVQDNTPIEIVPRLYIGSLYTAFNQDAMVSLGITHILNSSRLGSIFTKQIDNSLTYILTSCNISKTIYLFIDRYTRSRAC